MSNLAWKLRRLRAMGIAEVFYRIRQTARGRLEQRGFGLARAGAPTGTAGHSWLAVLPCNFDAAAYSAAADRVLAGHFDVFALRDTALGFPPQWNRDPKTGTLAPLAFGKTLNYRDERIVGDIKYLWEPNRHAELVTLAQAWHLTHEKKYAEGSRILLESWFEQCPYPLGANWTSALEHGVRLANWAVAWFFLGLNASSRSAWASDTLVQRWQQAIHQHCHFIAGHFSRHSSANNHLLGELMGLFIGATVWPLWPESARWQKQAAREFEAEALKQNGEDGVNREQAIWYQHEVADMMLLVGLFGRANGIEFSVEYWQRLERMLELIAALMDEGSRVPMIGDADDARLVRLDPRREADVFRSLLATGAVLFERGDFKKKTKFFDDKSRWLLGDTAEKIFDELAVPPQEVPRQDFPLGGYSVLGGQFGTTQEIRVVADAGPLGYLAIAAHGHADALAFTLSAGGREILIDPGTYAYHTQPQWRNYFKSTSAHNTVRVDGVDQSVSSGNFLWSQHAQTRRERLELDGVRSIWTGSHDGYLRLRDPVLHRRTIVCDAATGTLWVTDRLECRGSHRIELFFHFSEDCHIEQLGDVVLAKNGPVGVRLCNTTQALAPGIVRGQENPPLGWVSRRFDEKKPCPVAIWSGTIHGTTELVTEISVSFL